MMANGLRLGEFGDERLAKGGLLLSRMAARHSICQRRLAGSDAAALLGFRGFSPIPG